MKIIFKVECISAKELLYCQITNVLKIWNTSTLVFERIYEKIAWGDPFEYFSVINIIIQDELVSKFKDAMKEFYPDGVEKSKDYARIVNDRHFQ